MFHASDDMTPLHALKRHARTIAAFAALGLLVSAAITFLQPLRYGATVRLLIIQRSSFGLDPFTAIKSAERVAENLSQVITTTDFFTNVLAQDPAIDRMYFSDRQSARRRQWRRMVRASIASGTGLLTITILHPKAAEATSISQAVADVFRDRGRDYVGGDIEIKLVDAPIPSRYPISPDIPLNLAGGLVLGGLVGIVLVLRRSVPA